MCGHFEKVSRRVASLNINALSVGSPSNGRPGNRPFSRSLMAEAIGNAGIYRLNLFNSVTNPEHTSFKELCGNSKHTVFHYDENKLLSHKY